MRSPSDPKFRSIHDMLISGQMVGTQRPIGRVTWSKARLKATASTKAGVGAVRAIDRTAFQFEIGTVRNIRINRSIGQDAATCTITMYNTSDTSNRPEGIDTAGRKGYLTPGRGEPKPHTRSVFGMWDRFSPFPTEWGYPVNQYRDVFIPNTVLRTYQGYGSDNFDQWGNPFAPGHMGYVHPEDDSKLYLTGTWLIDRVTYGADGIMTIECRDFAKLLIEQMIYPPLLPMGRFPLIYRPAHAASGHKEKIGKNVAVYHSSSVDHRFGHNARVMGHRGTDAFDTRYDSYWLSCGNGDASGMEWLQAKTHGPINEITLNTWGGNYLIYVSVHEHGKWQGTKIVTGSSENLGFGESSGDGEGFKYVITSGDTLWDLAGTYYGKNELWPIIARANSNIIQDPHWIYPGQRIKIPYVSGTKSPPPAGGNGTGDTRESIPYVARAAVPRSGRVTIHLNRTYNADYVRVSFTNLHKFEGQYRVGVRTLNARNHILNTYNPGNINKASYIQDWTEPMKELCAWAGLTWIDATPNQPDPVLGTSRAGKPLRVWGDFERLGAGPVVATPGDYFVSKSFMDGIRQIVDFIGGIFFIDETGGAQFRLPNIWSGGNFIDDPSALSTLSARIPQHPIEFHEDVNLISYEVVISDESVRSEVLVIGGYPSVNSTGPVAGGYVLGYNTATHTTSAIDFTDILAGQYRLTVVPGDATKLFYTEAECQRMAELTALFILFTYRQGSLKAPCHPGLQIDDQVRIFERTTNESDIHYVSGISSYQDLESGEYTMDVTTHWLGGDPNTNWFINKAMLTPAVKQLPAILKRIGREAGGDSFEQPPYGT